MTRRAQAARVVVSTAVEGIVDQAVAQRLLTSAGHGIGPVHVKGGKARLLEKIDGYNGAAQRSPWLVLVDLDRDEDCAPPFVAAKLPSPAPGMQLRVAVRQIEAWLMGDREHLARFLKVRQGRVPSDPEGEEDAKRALVDLARRSSNAAIRAEMVPRPASGRRTGPAYAARLIEFAQGGWRPEVAARRVESLDRCLGRLREL